MKVKKAFALLVGVLLVFSGAEASVVRAQEPSDGLVLTESLEQEYRDLFERKGIDDPQVQQGLLDRLRSGEMLDADNPDVEPIYSEEEVQDNRVVTYSMFPDGSVATTTVGSDPYASRAGYGIKNCRSYNHGNWRRHDNCRIVYDGMSFSYSFYADYSTRRRGNVNAVIRKVYSPTIHRAIGHSTSSPNLTIVRKWQNGNATPAVARMSFQATPFRVLWTTTLSIRLQVSGSRAVATS